MSKQQTARDANTTVRKIIVAAGREPISFHFFDDAELQDIWLRLEGISVHLEQPSLAEIPDGATTHRMLNGKPVAGVFDSDNRLVPQSALVRGTDYPCAEPDPDFLFCARRDDRDAYYLGRGDSHYGHFVLETLCRAWAWEKYGEQRVPVIQSRVPPFGRALYELIPDLMGRMEQIRSPTRFRHVLVPSASFVFARESYFEFKNLCERIAARAAESVLPQTDQPLYLSRAGVSPNRRTFEGESRLERLLESEGFRVVRPEILPIRQQIALFDAHKWIVAPMGSACHTRLFSRRSNTLVMLTSSYFSPNYVLCDLMCEGHSHYLNVFVKPCLGTGTRLLGFLEPAILDEDNLLTALKDFGLVRSSAVFDGPGRNLREYKLRWIDAARWQVQKRPRMRNKLLRAIEDVIASLDAPE